MNTFGKNVKICLFGEINNKTIGLTIDSLPAGYYIDIDKIKKNINEYQSKNPSCFKYDLSKFSIISGLSNKCTTGAPITIILEQKQTRNEIKEGTIIFDSFDYSTYLKYYGTQSLENSVYLHHQLLKLMIIVGEISKQVLSSYKINIFSRIYSLKNVKDEEIDYSNFTINQYLTTIDDSFPMFNKRAVVAAQGEIKKAKSINESLGGSIETFIFNLPATLGEPIFDGFESTLSHLLFSIPFIRGIEFGDITHNLKKYGSKTTDELEYVDGNLNFISNHQGGINMGITNGNLIYFKSMIKAPSNIPKNLKSVNVLSKQNIEISSTSDYSISYIPDSIYLVETLSYFVILDLIIENKKIKDVYLWKF